jgi:L-rhamnonate dehydratase
MASPRIVDVRAYLIDAAGDGGDYHRQKNGHWIIDSLISNPMSGYAKYRASRLSWGIDILGSILVQIEDDRGNVGFATGFGGLPACYLIEKHFKRFLIAADPRDLNLLWDQMFRASMYYGRKGLTLAAISVVDLALWDLIGKIRQEPIFKFAGGRTKESISLYCTGPRPDACKAMGFFGGKVPLPHGPADGIGGIRANYAVLKKHRDTVGPDYPLMVDCYMSLDVRYAIELADKCRDLGIHWWEEALHPDDFDGHMELRKALPTVKWTTGEHEYSRYGFRKLIEGRAIDILQPDVMWAGGLSELIKIAAHAAAYDIPVVPHGSGPYSYHFAMSQTNAPFCEYVANSPNGMSVQPVFGKLFRNEPVPVDGVIDVSDAPGFGLDLNDEVPLRRPVLA